MRMLRHPEIETSILQIRQGGPGTTPRIPGRQHSTQLLHRVLRQRFPVPFPLLQRVLCHTGQVPQLRSGVTPERPALRSLSALTQLLYPLPNSHIDMHRQASLGAWHGHPVGFQKPDHGGISLRIPGTHKIDYAPYLGIITKLQQALHRGLVNTQQTAQKTTDRGLVLLSQSVHLLLHHQRNLGTQLGIVGIARIHAHTVANQIALQGLTTRLIIPMPHQLP